VPPTQETGGNYHQVTNLEERTTEHNSQILHLAKITCHPLIYILLLHLHGVMGIISHGGEGKPTKEKRRGGRGATAEAAAAASKQRTDLEDGGEDGAGATPAACEGPGAERAGEEECPSESGPRGQRGCAPVISKIQEP